MLLALSAILAAAWLFRPVLPSTCSMKIMVGVGCPGCGMTRSVSAAAHGQILKSLQLHILGPFVLLAVVVAWFMTLFGARVSLTSPWITRGLVGFVAVLLVYWVVRLLLRAVP